MTVSMRLNVVCLTAIVPLMTASSCVPPIPDGTTLTPEEQAAVDAASRSLFQMAEAAAVAGVAATGQPAPAKNTDSTTSVAGCPVLTLSPADGPGVFNISLNFGEGCPLPGQEAPNCAGAAVGQIDLNVNRLNLTLQSFACGEAATLDGTMDVTYTLSDSTIVFDGLWDLTFTTAEEQTRITGPGVVTFDTAAQVVTINQFQGQLTRGTDTWNITVDSVQIALVGNPSRLPSAGTVQLDGGFLRQLTIRFNADTPATQVVEVSIFGLFFFPVDLNTLDL